MMKRRILADYFPLGKLFLLSKNIFHCCLVIVLLACSRHSDSGGATWKDARSAKSGEWIIGASLLHYPNAWNRLVWRTISFFSPSCVPDNFVKVAWKNACPVYAILWRTRLPRIYQKSFIIKTLLNYCSLFILHSMLSNIWCRLFPQVYDGITELTLANAISPITSIIWKVFLSVSRFFSI